MKYRLVYTRRAERDIKKLELNTLLIENPRHPSLGLKKIKGHPSIWEGRVTKSYRFTFQISGEIYILRRIGIHGVLNESPCHDDNLLVD